MTQEEQYQAFWNDFFVVFKRKHPGWKSMGDRTKNHQHFEAGYPNSNYSAAFVSQRSGGVHDFYVELEAVPKLYKALQLGRKRIDESFDHPLIWEPPSNQQKRRITCKWGEQITIHDRQHWPAVCNWAIARLGELREVLV